MVFRFLVGVLFSVLGATLFASSIPVNGKYKSAYRNFDKHFIKQLKQWGINGATVAVVKNHRLTYLRAYGWANTAKKQAMQTDNLFRIASISKTITAIAVLKLVQQGKLKLNDKVYKVLALKPLPGRNTNRKVYQITIADLLHMSSGWAKWFDPMFGPWPKSYVKKLHATPPVSCERAARFMLSQPLTFRPGTQFRYANINYCLLGLVVSKVSANQYTRQAYVDYVQKNILHPLGIDDMYIANTTLGEQPKKEVHYYPTYQKRIHYPANKNMIVLWDLPYGHDEILQKNFANGGWVATAYDLVKLINRLQLGQIINKRLLKDMTSMPNGYRFKRGKTGAYLPYLYGMGWFLLYDTPYTVRWYTHGSFTGTNSMIVRRHNGTIYVALFNEKPSSYAKVSLFRRQVMNLFLRYA